MTSEYRDGRDICSCCHEYKHDVRWCYDPFAYEMEGEKYYSFMCAECYEEKVMGV